MSDERPVKFLIAAGGTGGHLFPALHIARGLESVAKSRGVSAQIQFAGAGRPLEKELLDSSPYRRNEIKISGLKGRGLHGVLEFLRLLPRAVKAVRDLLESYQPDVVIGVGGYVSVLPVVLARLKGIPTWIHECELHPGLANWLLSFFARRISVAFALTRMPRQSKVLYSGMPVREGLREIREKGALEGRPEKILFMGGSQGANAIDLAVEELLPFFTDCGLQVWHQCRKENLEKLTRLAGAAYRVEPFIKDPLAAYAWAQIIVSRAGASSVMEIGAVNKPAIFVPYPFAQGNHQTFNARTLVDQGKAFLVEEGPDFTSRLKAALSGLLNPVEYRAVQNHPYIERSGDAAERIAEGCFKLAGK